MISRFVGPLGGSILLYRGISLLYLKNQRKKQKIEVPTTPVITRTHWNACCMLKIEVSKFIPNIPVTTPKIATTNVAVVNSSSN
jgi:hypothetical protein